MMLGWDSGLIPEEWMRLKSTMLELGSGIQSEVE